MPKVSVVVPNYNHARFLRKRLESVLGQTFQDFEVIFLDDASTDDSKEIYEQFANDSRIRSIFNEKNSGSVFKQWNKGFRAAKGEYIWIAESDDFADNRFLETLVPKLDANPNAGVAYCQSWIVDEHDTKQFIVEYTRKRIDADRWKSDFTNNGPNECARYLILGCTINNASSAIVRRSVVEKIGYAEENWRISGDWVFWAKMLMQSDIEFIARPLNCWRCHTSTVRNSGAGNGLNIADYYRASAFIASHANIRPEVLERARVLRFNGWMHHNEVTATSIAQNHVIYSEAKCFDNKVNLRLALYLPRMPVMLAIRRTQRLLRPILRRLRMAQRKNQCSTT
jgi:glycosyltransferase involved in cell wall biosynthesis